VLHQVIDELRLSSPGRQIEADYAIDSPVDCDRSRIGQLVSNLVGNALSHGSSNEPVRVRAETANGLFRFSVANGGEPIPPAALEDYSNRSFGAKYAPADTVWDLDCTLRRKSQKLTTVS